MHVVEHPFTVNARFHVRKSNLALVQVDVTGTLTTFDQCPHYMYQNYHHTS